MGWLTAASRASPDRGVFNLIHDPMTSGHAWKVLGPPAPTPTSRDVAHIEWDRGHDEFDAVVYLDEADALVVARTHDYWPQAGFLWIRRSEVLSLDPLDEAEPAMRVLEQLGVRRLAVDPAIADLKTLLLEASDPPVPIAVFSRKTGSEEMLVGLVSHVGDTGCTLTEVDPAGSLTGDDLTLELDDIIAIEWSTDYLNALSILLALPES